MVRHRGGSVGGEIAAFEAFAASQEASALKHVLCVGVQRPVVALPGPSRLSGDFDEAVVEREIVPDGVLPFFGIVPVEREAICDELVDASECELAIRGAGDGHGDERDVAVGRFPSLQRPLPAPTFGRIGILRLRCLDDRLSRSFVLRLNHRHLVLALEVAAAF